MELKTLGDEKIETELRPGTEPNILLLLSLVIISILFAIVILHITNIIHVLPGGSCLFP